MREILQRLASATGRRFDSGTLASIPLKAVGVIVASAMLLPLVYLGVRASEAGSGAVDILASYSTLEVFANSVVLTLVVTALSAVIAVIAALLTVKTDLPAKRFWTVILAMPLAIPSFVGSFAIIATFAPRGSLLQNLLAPLGVESLPSIYGWPGAVLALTLFTYPYVFLTTRAALQGMDPAIEEVSGSLGHGARSTLRRVTLPHLSPSIAAGSLLVAFYTLSDFGTPALMQFDSFTRVIFVEYELAFNRHTAAILSLLLISLVFVILYLEHRARGREHYSAAGPGSRRPPLIMKLGRWKWPSLIFCGVIGSMSIFIPLGTMLYWYLQGLVAGTAFPDLGLVTLNTVYVAVMATLLIVSLALPVALLTVRFPGKTANVIEKLSYIGFAMPGIAVALALVSFGANYLPMLYQTLGMLIFAYVVLFISLSIGIIRSNLLQLDPRVEEVARSLGLGPARTLLTVTIPMIRVGLLTGAALVIITIMKELPATLLLSPIEFRTLATQIWTGTETASFSHSAASALVLVAVSAISIVIILSQEKGGRRGETYA